MDVEEMFRFKECTLRQYKPEDLEVLVDLINHGYSYLDKHRGKPRTDAEHLTRHAKEKQFYVVEKGDDMVACFYIEKKKHTCHFGMLVVDDEHRGTGLGVALVGFIERFAKENSYKYVELDYMSVTPWLKTYYEKLGYKETGKVEPWDNIDLINMKKGV